MAMALAMDESRLIVERDFSPRISQEDTPRRSLAAQFSSLAIIDGIFSRKTFSYNTLPSQPLRLSVLKLDGSSFDIEVAKTATIAELKQAVEAVFSHMPQNGPGKISWPHVWGQFCLCYDGQKLVTEKDYLKNYGIKDGDQLYFIRHVSNSSNFKKKRFKKKVVHLKRHRRCRSSSQVNSYEPKEHSDDDDIGYDDIAMENGKIQNYNEGEDHVRKTRLLTGFLGGLFSYTRVAVVRKTRTKGRICPSMIARCLLGSFRKIRRIVRFCRRRHYSQRHAWRQY